MSQDQQAEKQWVELGYEVPHSHEHTEEEHLGVSLPHQADQWQELGDEEPQQVEVAEPIPQEQHPDEANGNQRGEEASEEHRPEEHHCSHAETEHETHQPLGAHHEEEPAAPADQWAEIGEEPPQPHHHGEHETHQPLRAYHEEDVTVPAPPADQWAELDKEPQEHHPEEHNTEHHHHKPPEHEQHVQLRAYHEESAITPAQPTEEDGQTPALRAYDEEHGLEAIAPPAKEHYDGHNEYPSTQPGEEQQDYPVEDTCDPQAEPAQKWDEIGEEQPQPHHHGERADAPAETEHETHQPLGAHHEEEPAAPADQWAEIGEEQPQPHHHGERADAPAETQHETHQPLGAHHEEEPAAPADQWAEIGEEQPQPHHHGEHADAPAETEHETHQPLGAHHEEEPAAPADQWAEIGEEQPQPHHHGERADAPAETEHETHETHQPLGAHHEEEPAAPADQWAEIGEEQPQPHHHGERADAPAETEHETHQPLGAHHEEEPAAPADQWAEIGEEQPQPHHHGEHADAPAETQHETHQPLGAHHEEKPAAPADQWAEIGEEQPQPHHHGERADAPAETEHETHQPLGAHHEEEPAAPADQWAEIGEEQPQPHHHGERADAPAETEHETHETHQPLGAHHEEEPAAPADQWAEIGEEQPQPHHHGERADAPAETEHETHQPLGAHHEEEPAAPADQWAEIGEEQPQPHHHGEHADAPAETQHETHQPLGAHHEEKPAAPADQWAEIGEEQPQPHHHGERADAPAETEHETHQPLGAHHEEEPAAPADQWAEIGEEQPQPHHHGERADAPAETEHETHQPLGAHHEEEPAAPADQWAEIGEEQPQPHHQGEHADAPAETEHEEEPHAQDTHSMPPPQAAQQHLGAIVKPKSRNVKSVARWEPVEHQACEGSDDEFELSTCMAPVYEDETGNEDASVFKNGEPDCQGEIMSCFDEPNLLYRIIDPKEKTWAFYNDSLNYEMHVQFTFGKHSKLQPLENAVMKQNDEGQYVTEVVVYPTETEMFVQGNVNGFTSKLRAVPLSDEYHDAHRKVMDEQVANETAAIQQLTDSDNAEDVLQVCIENGIAFVDPEFPPCQASLEAGAAKPFKPFAWARPQACVPEEMAAQVRLFRSNVRPGCVDAGDLGDSWVMCSVAAVSEDPARLMGMFRHPEGKAAAQREHAVGAYRVTFNKNGWWRSVLVDSYLPVSAGKLKYAKSAVDPAEIWPAILEKAYAKLHGSYAKICSGDPLHALQDMTGFSTSRFDDALTSTSNQKPTELFDDLVRGIAAGYTVICSTPGRGPFDKDQELSEKYGKVGLVTGHAYTILDAKYVADLKVRIVKVRNAWGRGLEWNGDWNDNDSKWEEYPEVAAACDFQKAADGTFWMPWEAAQKYFNGGGVCFSHQPAYDYRINSVFTSCVPSAVLEIEVSSPTWFTFVISQDDKRCQENVTEYQPVMISIAEPVDNGMYKVVLNSSADGVHPTADKWTFLQARDISLIHKLDAGKYIIVPRIMPLEGQAEQVPYVLGMITNKEVGGGDVSVKFKRLDASNRVFENFPKFEPELKEVEQPVQYQKRAPGEGFPLTQMGEELA